MSKKNILWIILDLVFLVIFNVVFFVASGIQNPTSVWISYGFIHLSYTMLLITPLLIRNSSNASIFGFSLYAISNIYFLVTLSTGIVFIVMRSETYKASLLVQIIITGIFVAMLLLHIVANKQTADNIERHENELQYVKQSSAMLKGIMDKADNYSLQKKIEKAYDLLHSSQVKSCDEVRDYEIVVLKLIDALKENVTMNNVAAANITLDEIMKNANERNRRLRY